jgi:PadR family transcriptional regulator, regulatory protein PadR
MSDIPRLSTVEGMILRLLVGGEMYGLELVDASDGAVKRGTVYVTLGRMADKGLVTSRAVKLEHERGLPRRLFKMTGLGERILLATQTAEAIWGSVQA